MENYKKQDKNTSNLALLLISAILLIFGVLMIYSASSNLALVYRDGDMFFYVKRQIMWILLGSGAACLFYYLSFDTLRKLSYVITAGSLLLILYTLPKALFQIDMPFVNTLNGATRWIDLGLFDLQPSEVFKFGIIIFTASWLTISQSTAKSIEKFIRSFKNQEYKYNVMSFVYALFPLVTVIVGSLLILLQKDFDTIIIVFLGFAAAYYVGTNEKYQKTAIKLVLFLGVIGSVFALIGVDYRRQRVDAFMQILIQGEPSYESKRAESFQVWNGLVGIGSGGLVGLGYGESRQKLFFLQEAAYTDSIYAIIGEEFGLAGSLSVIFLFLLFISYGFKIAKESTDKFGTILATGITVGIASQAFLNIAANLAVIPFGGITLPFVSYGGSSTVITLVSLALLLKIGAHQKSKTTRFS